MHYTDKATVIIVINQAFFIRYSYAIVFKIAGPCLTLALKPILMITIIYIYQIPSYVLVCLCTNKFL